MLSSLQLAEPIISSMVSLLQANLNGNITALNATLTDSYTVPSVAQFLPFMPNPSTIAGGLPIVAVTEMAAQFEDDLQFRLDAEHTFAVVGIVQNADQATLAWQLRRLMQAVAYTIEQDRLSTSSVMRAAPALAWSIEFLRTEPGPLLGEPNPASADGPPVSFLSYTGLVLSAKRGEVTG